MAEPTRYQRVTTATDYDTSGFSIFLKADGTDDGGSTNSIDFTGTDKVTVFAGVRKMGSAVGILAELSNYAVGNAGAFYLASNDGSSQEKAAVHGTGVNLTVSGFVSETPSAYVHTASLDVSKSATTDQLKGRGNGVPYITYDATPTASATSFGDYPLFLFARNNSSLYFNGRLYGLIVLGRAATATEIANTERYLNQKGRLYA